ncbi:Putative fatty-acid--CoA ligase FadD21 [Seminavis robusta]|uniref:Fatty-acid--CoA ligase FadD21 n=1 Tax=Seminavis robusta TaxID=568900 RepID=A0A9N8DW43_9STRA|nr:Putative fatty-acid--CoA ligase FadD21 [Seminavis robusta]|eukprot:Sro395_g134070.1 Putative fatty-acid--CoA ligase FadD21 (2551) ;mRNA; r:30708-38456
MSDDPGEKKKKKKDKVKSFVKIPDVFISSSKTKKSKAAKAALVEESTETSADTEDAASKETDKLLAQTKSLQKKAAKSEQKQRDIEQDIIPDSSEAFSLVPNTFLSESLKALPPKTKTTIPEATSPKPADAPKKVASTTKTKPKKVASTKAAAAPKSPKKQTKPKATFPKMQPRTAQPEVAATTKNPATATKKQPATKPAPAAKLVTKPTPKPATKPAPATKAAAKPTPAAKTSSSTVAPKKSHIALSPTGGPKRRSGGTPAPASIPRPPIVKRDTTEMSLGLDQLQQRDSLDLNDDNSLHQYYTGNLSVQLLRELEMITLERHDETFATFYEADGKATQTLTFGDLWDKSGVVSYHLRVTWKLQKGQTVALVLDYGLTYMATWLGCLRAGVVPIIVASPIPPNFEMALTKLNVIMHAVAPVAMILTDSVVKFWKKEDENDRTSSTRKMWPEQAPWKAVDKLPKPKPNNKGSSGSLMASLSSLAGSFSSLAGSQHGTSTRKGASPSQLDLSKQNRISDLGSSSKKRSSGTPRQSFLKRMFSPRRDDDDDYLDDDEEPELRFSFFGNPIGKRDSGAAAPLPRQSFRASLFGQGEKEPLLAGTAFDEKSLKASDVCCLQATSGSTADPKVVVVTFQALYDCLKMTRRALPEVFGKHSSLAGLTWVPPDHHLGLFLAMVCPLLNGCPMHYMSSGNYEESPLQWLTLLSTYRIGWTLAPDNGYRWVIREFMQTLNASTTIMTSLNLSSLKVLLNIGESPRFGTPDKFRKCFVPYNLPRDCSIKTGYGLAEHVLPVSWIEQDVFAVPSCNNFALTKRVAVANRNALEKDNIAIVVIDSRNNQPVSKGQLGEIWIWSPYLAHLPGYFRNKKLTKKNFQAKIKGKGSKTMYLRTGDVGLFKDDHLYICCRKEDVLANSQGIKFCPPDIEWFAEDCRPEIRRGRVAAMASVAGTVEIALEVYESTKSAYTRQLCRILSERIPKFTRMEVSSVVAVPQGTLPITPISTVQRRHAKGCLLKEEMPMLFDFPERKDRISLDRNAELPPTMDSFSHNDEDDQSERSEADTPKAESQDTTMQKTDQTPGTSTPERPEEPKSVPSPGSPADKKKPAEVAKSTKERPVTKAEAEPMKKSPGTGTQDPTSFAAATKETQKQKAGVATKQAPKQEADPPPAVKPSLSAKSGIAAPKSKPTSTAPNESEGQPTPTGAAKSSFASLAGKFGGTTARRPTKPEIAPPPKEEDQPLVSASAAKSSFDSLADKFGGKTTRGSTKPSVASVKETEVQPATSTGAAKSSFASLADKFGGATTRRSTKPDIAPPLKETDSASADKSSFDSLADKFGGKTTSRGSTKPAAPPKDSEEKQTDSASADKSSFDSLADKFGGKTTTRPTKPAVPSKDSEGPPAASATTAVPKASAAVAGQSPTVEVADGASAVPHSEGKTKKSTGTAVDAPLEGTVVPEDEATRGVKARLARDEQLDAQGGPRTTASGTAIAADGDSGKADASIPAVVQDALSGKADAAEPAETQHEANDNDDAAKPAETHKEPSDKAASTEEPAETHDKPSSQKAEPAEPVETHDEQSDKAAATKSAELHEEPSSESPLESNETGPVNSIDDALGELGDVVTDVPAEKVMSESGLIYPAAAQISAADTSGDSINSVIGDMVSLGAAEESASDKSEEKPISGDVLDGDDAGGAAEEIDEAEVDEKSTRSKEDAPATEIAGLTETERDGPHTTDADAVNDSASGLDDGSNAVGEKRRPQLKGAVRASYVPVGSPETAEPLVMTFGPTVEETVGSLDEKQLDEVISRYLGPDFDNELSWEESGLSSAASVPLRRELEREFLTTLPPDYLDRHPTPADLKGHIRDTIGGPIDTNKPPLETQKSHQLSWCTIGLLQAFLIVIMFILFSAPLVPCWLVFEQLQAMNKPALYMLFVPLYLGSFSVIVIVAKWLVICRYRECLIVTPSFAYLRFWFVDRLVAVWECWVGRFILDTPLIWLFYTFMGARLSPSCQLAGFIREFDLVSIGANSSLKYPCLKCRKFIDWDEPNIGPTMAFRRISIGDHCTVRGMLSPGVQMDDGSIVQNLCVVPEGAVLPGESLITGNPAYVADEVDPRKYPCWILVGVIKMIWIVLELGFLYGIWEGAMFLNPPPETSEGFDFAYWAIFAATCILISLLSSIVLKILFIGSRRPGKQNECWCYYPFEWACDYHFNLVTLPYRAFARNSRFSNVVLMLHGCSIDWASKIELDSFPPSKMDLIRVRRSMLGTVTLSVKSDGVYYRTNIEDSSIGHFSHVDTDVLLMKALVPPLTFVDESVVHHRLDPMRAMGDSCWLYIHEVYTFLLDILLFVKLCLTCFVSYSVWLLLLDFVSLETCVPICAASLAAQGLVWNLGIILVERIRFCGISRGSYNPLLPGFHYVYRTMTRTFQEWSFLKLTYGSPIFNVVASMMGTTYEGRSLYFGDNLYDFRLATIADRTVLDGTTVAGHNITYGNIKYGPSNVAGLVHDKSFIMANNAYECSKEETGPWEAVVEVPDAEEVTRISSGRISILPRGRVLDDIEDIEASLL